jgi:hypothetical protein
VVGLEQLQVVLVVAVVAALVAQGLQVKAILVEQAKALADLIILLAVAGVLAQWVETLLAELPQVAVVLGHQVQLAEQQLLMQVAEVDQLK